MSLERLRAALAGRYAVEREIGAGGMATVYLAQDPVSQSRRFGFAVHGGRFYFPCWSGSPTTGWRISGRNEGRVAMRHEVLEVIIVLLTLTEIALALLSRP